MCCTTVIHLFSFVFELHSAFSTFRLFTKEIELHFEDYVKKKEKQESSTK
jgi:hypothetical protein